MIIRPVDENDDMMPVSSLDQMATGVEAVAQVVRANLELILGEWWEDEELGISVPDFMINNARAQDVEMIEQYLTMYILKVQGVSSIRNVIVNYENHQMTYSCIVEAEGESEEVEVNLNGLL